TCSCWVSEDVGDATQWDVHPLGAVVELVAELVDGLLEQERVEEDAGMLGVGGQERLPVGRIEVAAQEPGADPAVPVVEPAAQLVVVGAPGGHRAAFLLEAQ